MAEFFVVMMAGIWFLVAVAAMTAGRRNRNDG